MDVRVRTRGRGVHCAILLGCGAGLCVWGPGCHAVCEAGSGEVHRGGAQASWCGDTGQLVTHVWSWCARSDNEGASVGGRAQLCPGDGVGQQVKAQDCVAVEPLRKDYTQVHRQASARALSPSQLPPHLLARAHRLRQRHHHRVPPPPLARRAARRPHRARPEPRARHPREAPQHGSRLHALGGAQQALQAVAVQLAWGKRRGEGAGYVS